MTVSSSLVSCAKASLKRVASKVSAGLSLSSASRGSCSLAIAVSFLRFGELGGPAGQPEHRTPPQGRRVRPPNFSSRDKKDQVERFASAPRHPPKPRKF